jgi:hypothetical protein
MFWRKEGSSVFLCDNTRDFTRFEETLRFLSKKKIAAFRKYIIDSLL